MNVCLVNEKKYEFPDGASIRIIDEDVYINEKKFIEGKGFTEKVINITIEGNVNELETGCAKATINGNCGCVKSGSGDITVHGNVNGGISTGSGDVVCGDVAGNIKTGSGDVSCKNCDSISQKGKKNNNFISMTF